MQNSMMPRIEYSEELMDKSVAEGLLTYQEWEAMRNLELDFSQVERLYFLAALAMLEPEDHLPN